MRGLNLYGVRFGGLTALRLAPKSYRGDNYWVCLCDCGQEITIEAYKIKSYDKCWKCKRGNFYKELKYIGDDQVELIVPSKKYGDCSIYIDKEDLGMVLSFWWGIIKHHGVLYAQGWCRRHDDGRRRGGRLHQFILGFPNKIIDHKNHNGLDNRKTNLRLATPSQSTANRRISKNKAVPFNGVSYIKKKNLYVVQLSKDNKIMNFGRFKNPLIAAAKYNEMALKYHGEFAVLNTFTKEQIAEIESPPLETRRISKNNTTGFIGVSYSNQKYCKKRYVATIYHDGKNIYLGSFENPKEAALAYNTAAKKYKGDKASLNIII